MRRQKVFLSVFSIVFGFSLASNIALAASDDPQCGSAKWTCAVGSANGLGHTGCVNSQWQGGYGSYGAIWDCIGENAYRGKTVSCFSAEPTDLKCPPDAIQYPTGTANPPLGNLDSVTCQGMSGSGYDPDHVREGTYADFTVKFYDGPKENNKFIGSSSTSSSGSLYMRKFSFSTPNSIKDGSSHTVYAYGVDIETGTLGNVFTHPISVSCSGTGTGGGTAVSCGSENGKTIPARGPEWRQLCTDSAEPSNFQARKDAGGFWNGWQWNCGSSPCSASLSPGECGTANGTVRTSAPSTVNELCKSGVATAISGAGPWTWNCTGRSCNADKSASSGGGAAGDFCGSSNGGSFSTEPLASQLCASGATLNGQISRQAPFAPNPNGSWRWSCKSSNGSISACWATDTSQTPIGEGGGDPNIIRIDGTCGSAARNYAETETAFSGSFCRTGVPEPINASFPQVNSSSNWTCKGMTGGKDSSICTAMRVNASQTQSCSVYTVASSIPEDYGSPFNQLSSAKEPLLSVTCVSNGATATAGSQNTYVYKTGFVTENGQWKKIDFSGTPAPNNEGWLQGGSLANVSAAPSSGQNFVIAFVCQYDGGKWKCGCRDSACAQNHWTIQAYKK